MSAVLKPHSNPQGATPPTVKLLINGKFVEGHVPAEQVLALSKRDDLLGVAAPGMPMGSPGMEMDGMSDAYQVIGLTKTGTDVVVADYPAH